VIAGGRPGPVLVIRGDMDALPIAEKTGLPWASRVDGLMHACGHDLHTTTLLGVAAVLSQLAPQLAGTVKLVFQPAEETIGGMRAMLDAGVLEDPKVDMALGFHNSPDIPAGRFAYTPGRRCGGRQLRGHRARRFWPCRASAHGGRSGGRGGAHHHPVADRGVA